MDTTDTAAFDASFTAIAAQRAAIYRWFADWLAAERSPRDLAHYDSPQAAALWRFFADCGLAQESAALQSALDAALTLPDAHLELAADFAAAFLLAGNDCAAPYASWYMQEGKTFYGDAEKQMRAFLAAQGLQIRADFKEPADHLAVFLAYFAQGLTEQDGKPAPQRADEQADFLEQALLGWLPLWRQRCARLSLKTAVYPALADLLSAFVQADRDYLRDG